MTSMQPGALPPDCASRIQVFESPLGLIEHLRSGHEPESSGEGFSPEFQVCLPTRGLFVWHVEGDEVVGDPNHALFVTAGERYRLSQPVGGGYAELIITPDVELLAETTRAPVGGLSNHPLFRVRSARVDPAVQQLGASVLRRRATGHRDDLRDEETMVALLRSTLDAERPLVRPSGATGRLIRRTKEHLEGHLGSSLRLADVARAVGASPAYLTSVFRQFEGLSLHKYVTQLRLARSLTALPHATDLTTLAVDLGFSSHSHFASAFRNAFHMTPSEFRGCYSPRSVTVGSTREARRAGR
jgi:AraC family transcriptional regulator